MSQKKLTRRQLAALRALPAQCKRCGNPKPSPRHHYCEDCLKLCSMCWAAPRTSSHYCKPCQNARKRALWSTRDQATKARHIFRIRIRHMIGRGERECHPCAVCDTLEGTQVFVVDAKREEYVFLCPDHHRDFQRFYGLTSKGKRVKATALAKAVEDIRVPKLATG